MKAHQDTANVEKKNRCDDVPKEEKKGCPLFNRPKILKLTRLEEFCAFLVWNG
jgi:hypothetical protein